MKVLVFEYVTGGGVGSIPMPSGLLEEAEQMQAALLEDLLEVPGISITALRDAQWPPPGGLETAIRWRMVEKTDNLYAVWLEALGECDAVWPIAPESGGVLECLSRDCEAAHKILLNSPSTAVAIAASKRRTIERLHQAGVPVVPTRAFRGYRPVFPLVIKPDDGISCQGIRIIRSPEEWDAALFAINPLHYVVQPLLDGDSLSFSALFDRGEASLLSCNRQVVVHRAGGLQLDAVEVNAVPCTAEHQALVAAVARAMPELRGYAGIDLLETARGLKVLEINPRLTTSASGLRAALNYNLSLIHI